MKAENLYLLFARDVITDPSDKMNTIVKIIDRISTDAIDRSALAKKDFEVGNDVIGVPVNCFYASLWIFDGKLKKDTKVTIKMYSQDPQGKILGGPEAEHNLPAGVDKISLNFKADVIPATTSGRYLLKAELISASNKILASAEYPYDVELKWHEEKVAN